MQGARETKRPAAGKCNPQLNAVRQSSRECTHAAGHTSTPECNQPSRVARPSHQCAQYNEQAVNSQPACLGVRVCRCGRWWPLNLALRDTQAQSSLLEAPAQPRQTGVCVQRQPLRTQRGPADRLACGLCRRTGQQPPSCERGKASAATPACLESDWRSKTQCRTLETPASRDRHALTRAYQNQAQITQHLLGLVWYAQRKFKCAYGAER